MRSSLCGSIKFCLSQIRHFLADSWCYLKSRWVSVFGWFYCDKYSLQVLLCQKYFVSVRWVISGDHKNCLMEVGSGHHLYCSAGLRASKPLPSCSLQMLLTWTSWFSLLLQRSSAFSRLLTEGNDLSCVCCRGWSGATNGNQILILV